MARAAFGSPMAALRQRIVAIQLLVTVLGVLSLVIPATSFAFELAALPRVVDDTRDVAAEVTKAVQRVERKNATRRDSLSAEARHSGAADISAPMLRAAGLEVDAARSQVRTTADRIERRETEIDLLDQQLERQAATQRADAEEAPAAEVEQQGPLGELRAVSAELLEALQRLADAEAEQLVLAEERLALLQSRVELGAIRDLGAFEEDPRVTALRAIVSRQTRDGTRLANEAAAIEPESVASSEQKQLLALQAHDAVARATQRLIDLDLLSIQGQIGFLDELAGNRAVPVRVLRDGRSELDVLRGRLEAQLQELTEERLALTDQRKLIGGQGGEASELV